MRYFTSVVVFLGFLAPLMASAPAHAQATRTWVSGVGDDANPCSRTAPCKTFAGAISKTAPAGEINCLDPGGFGAITITKSITIDCSETLAGVLVSGTNGVIINAAGANVVLRNLNIDGLNTGLAGVNIQAANNVWIVNVRVFEFTNQAIVDTRNSGGGLFITNTTARNNQGAGLGVAATGGTLKVVLDNFESLANGTGIAAGPGNWIMVTRSNLSGNTGAGVENDGGAIIVDETTISNNATGVLNNSGNVRLSNNNIALNNTGINNVSGGVFTFGTNRNSSVFTATSGIVTAAGGATSDLGQQ